MSTARRPISAIDQITGLQGALDARLSRRAVAGRDIPGQRIVLFEDDETWDGGTVVTDEPLVGWGRQSLAVEATGGAAVTATLQLVDGFPVEMPNPIADWVVQADGRVHDAISGSYAMVNNVEGAALSTVRQDAYGAYEALVQSGQTLKVPTTGWKPDTGAVVIVHTPTWGGEDTSARRLLNVPGTSTTQNRIDIEKKPDKVLLAYYYGASGTSRGSIISAASWAQDETIATCMTWAPTSFSVYDGRTSAQPNTHADTAIAIAPAAWIGSAAGSTSHADTYVSRILVYDYTPTRAEMAGSAAFSYGSELPVIEMLARLDDTVNFDAAAPLSLILSPDPRMRRYYTLNIEAPDQLSTGWNVIRAKWGASTNNHDITEFDTLSDDASYITTVRVGCKAASDKTATAHFAAVRAVRPRAVVILDHDDADSTISQAWAIEEKYGLRSTNYVNPGLVASGVTAYRDRTSQTWDDLWAAYRRGHDISNHGYMHRLLTTLTLDEQKAEIGDGWRELMARGFTRSARFLAAANGQFDANSVTAAKLYQTTLRASSGLLPPYSALYPVADRYGTTHRYRAISTASQPDISVVLGWVDGLIADGGFLHILTHGIGITDSAYDTLAEDYDALCSYLATADVDVLTMSEFYGYGYAVIGPEPFGGRISGDGTYERII